MTATGKKRRINVYLFFEIDEQTRLLTFHVGQSSGFEPSNAYPLLRTFIS